MSINIYSTRPLERTGMVKEMQNKRTPFIPVDQILVVLLAGVTSGLLAGYYTNSVQYQTSLQI